MSRSSQVNTSEHRFTVERLCAYLDGELSTKDARRVDQHLARCVECQRVIAQLRATVDLLRRSPVRPIPRSCTLPPSMQSEQASHRRWNTAYAVMRGGMVAVAAMLVLSLSVDTAFRTGLVPLPSEAPAASAKDFGVMAQQSEGVVVTQVVEKVVEREVEATVESESSVEAEGIVESEPIAALAAPAAEANSEVEADGASSLTAPTFKQAESPASSDTVAAGSPREGVREALLETSTEPEDGSAAQAEALALPVVGSEQPSAAAAAPAEEPAQPESAVDVAAAQPASESEGRGVAWAIWETARMLLGVLVGLLLVLAAGLLWAGQQRRV